MSVDCRSFLLYVSGFVTSEVAGTCAVLLYIYWTQRDWARKRLELHSINHRRKSNSSTQELAYNPSVYTAGKVLTDATFVTNSYHRVSQLARNPYQLSRSKVQYLPTAKWWMKEITHSNQTLQEKLKYKVLYFKALYNTFTSHVVSGALDFNKEDNNQDYNIHLIFLST